MRHIVLLSLLAVAGLANADVYKCQLTGKQVTYQDVPCSPDTADKNIVKIETQTPEQKEAALNKLKATETERQAMDKVDKEQQEAAAKTAAGRQEYYPYRGSPSYTPYPVYTPRYYIPNYGHRNPYPYVSRDLGGMPYYPDSGPNAHFPANSEARSMQGIPSYSPASPNFSPFRRR